MNYSLAVAVGKTVRFLLRRVRRGGGSAFPGLLVSKLAPNFLSETIKSLPLGFVIVSGSAGKSSTTHTLVTLLQDHGIRVFSNSSTANIQQGLLSAVLAKCDLAGKLNDDIAVLEVDEGHIAPLLSLEPKLVVLTNVLSDQLDRFVDPSTVIDRLAKATSSVPLSVINGDDPNLNQLPFRAKPIAVGLSAGLRRGKDAPKYAFNFRKPVLFPNLIEVSNSEGFLLKFGKRKFATSASTPQHALNDALALAAADQIVDLKSEIVAKTLAAKQRVFARNEKVQISGRDVNLRLVQNPTSFQLNLEELKGSEKPLMLMAGRDIHDPSWLWTVDFSKLKRVDVVGGYNAADLALRLHFAGVKVMKVIAEPAEAADYFLTLPGAKPTILFSADAMRRTRRHLGLAK
jgi:lipid II isoglutaminyl synthase (glutamine-hydrolysing)